jgi:hypothetical protein
LVGVDVIVGVFVAVAVSVTVGVFVAVSVTVGVFVAVAVSVAVGVIVAVAVSVTVGVTVGVAVGDWQKVEDVAVPMLPPPDASSSKVPNSPEVFTWIDAPALSWKEFVAIGVPLSSKV